MPMYVQRNYLTTRIVSSIDDDVSPVDSDILISLKTFLFHKTPRWEQKYYRFTNVLPRIFVNSTDILLHGRCHFSLLEWIFYFVTFFFAVIPFAPYSLSLNAQS